MHITSIQLQRDQFPTTKHYPFSLPLIQQMDKIVFSKPITFFIGENGSGKSTLLQAITQRCGVHIWQDTERPKYTVNPFENELRNTINVTWRNGKVHGSFFSSQHFRFFSQILDEWAIDDDRNLQRFGGTSLMAQSHGQSLMAYFQSRYKIKGLYFLDEPETALSPRSQIQLLNLLIEMSKQGHAQFIVATHSPILLACPDADIYSFDHIPVQKIKYEDTEYYKLYHAFLTDRNQFLETI
ncbi:AAA family ATPase [candidate division KSB1 bacterium]|nr:AAA family ATPase [candidate division KSB1 bacterium]